MKFRKFSDFSVTYVLLGSSDFQHEKVFSKVGQKMTNEMESSTCKKTMEEHRVIDPEIIYTRLRQYYDQVFFMYNKKRKNIGIQHRELNVSKMRY